MNTARHARSLADKLRRAAEEGQSPWTGEGTCLVFADAAKTLKALSERVESLEAENERLRELNPILVELARWSRVAEKNGDLHARIASVLALIDEQASEKP